MQFYVRLKRADYALSVLQVARFLVDLERLMGLCVLLGDKELMEGYWPYFYDYSANYRSFIEADRKFMFLDRFHKPSGTQIFLNTVRLQSPLQAKIGIYCNIDLSKTIKEILEIARYILTLKHQQNLIAAKTEEVRQASVRAALDNLGRAFDLANRIENVEVRQQFEERLGQSLTALLDGRYPKVEAVKVIAPPNRK